MIIDNDHLLCAFAEGARDFQFPGKVHLEIRELAMLAVPSGQIVACDPLVFPETEAFSPGVPRGSFPVLVTIAHIGSDQRVAFARVQFAEALPSSWLHVAQAGADVTALAYDEYFGYPVDAGIGCFMDAQAARQLVARMNSEEDYFETIIERIEETHVDTWGWASVTPADGPNVVCFSSGYGDGSYPSFLGLDDQSNPVCLVTDFMVVSGTEPRR